MRERERKRGRETQAIKVPFDITRMLYENCTSLSATVNSRTKKKGAIDKRTDGRIGHGLTNMQSKVQKREKKKQHTDLQDSFLLNSLKLSLPWLDFIALYLLTTASAGPAVKLPPFLSSSSSSEFNGQKVGRFAHEKHKIRGRKRIVMSQRDRTQHLLSFATLRRYFPPLFFPH